MKLKLGSIVTEATGKLGGHVAMQQGSSCVLRTAFKPVNRKHVRMRTDFAIRRSVFNSWNALSSSNKDLWRKFEYEGVSYFNAFFKLNYYLARNGQVLNSKPPKLVSLPSVLLSNFSLVFSSKSFTFSLVSSVPSGYALYVLYSKPVSSGCMVMPKNLLSITYLNQGSSGVISVGSGYTSRFGLFPRASQKVFIRTMIKSLSTGQVQWLHNYWVVCV